MAEHYGSQHFAQMDIGMASMALCYEASAMGLGTCMIGTMNQEKLKKSFGIPEDKIIRLIYNCGISCSRKMFLVKKSVKIWTKF